jgi:TonB family protein
MRLACVPLLALCIALAPAGAPAQEPSPTVPAAAPLAAPVRETTLLLDRALDGWSVPEGAASAATVVDGVLVLPDSADWTTTPQHLTDFTMRGEFRATAPASAAILLRAFFTGESGRPSHLRRGCEIRLPGAGGHESSVTVTENGTSHEFAGAPTRRAAPGAWRAFVIEAKSGDIIVTLDGQTVFAGTGASALPGRLALRARGGPVEWRRLAVEAAARPAAAPAAERPGANDPGITPPRPTRRPKPRYAADALARRVEGEVWLECIVRPDGAVADCRVIRSLEPSLDAAALAAARQWRFEPARRHGRPVEVACTIDMNFTLR